MLLYIIIPFLTPITMLKPHNPSNYAGCEAFLKFPPCTLRIRFFCLSTNIFHFFDRNDFLRSVEAKSIMQGIC